MLIDSKHALKIIRRYPTKPGAIVVNLAETIRLVEMNTPSAITWAFYCGTRRPPRLACTLDIIHRLCFSPVTANHILILLKLVGGEPFFETVTFVRLQKATRATTRNATPSFRVAQERGLIVIPIR